MVANTVIKKETIKKQPSFTQKELEVFKEADSYGFKFVTIGSNKAVFANSENEQKDDSKKIVNAKQYKKTSSGWAKI